MIETRTFPRAALAGNPSDGFFGKTLAFTFSDFQVDVLLANDNEESCLPAGCTTYKCNGLAGASKGEKLLSSQNANQLLIASVNGFKAYCVREHIPLEEKRFSLGFKSNIPFNVGLAGSSAIILACFRALMQFYNITISPPVLANEVLRVEVEQLNIAGGLQDRVAQVYQGIVYMDFDRTQMKSEGYGTYTTLKPKVLPNLYIAFNRGLSEPSNVLHSQLRQRWDSGDTQLINAMQDCALCAEKARDAIVKDNHKQLFESINTSFDYRQSAIPSSAGNMELIETARSAGVSANQAGSGGAIAGTFLSETDFKKLEKVFEARGIEVLRPTVASALDYSREHN